MTKKFSEILYEQNKTNWDKAVNHRFVKELANASISDEVMAGYLIQDHRFLENGIMLNGGAIVAADNFDSRIRLAQYVGVLAGGENTYFLRAFDALGITALQRQRITDNPATKGFNELLCKAANSLDYAAIMAVFVVGEWLYLDWAKSITGQLPKNFVHAEWITIHNNPEFEQFVSFIRGELDRVGETSPNLAAEYFKEAVDLELAFFDQAYLNPYKPN